MAGWSLWHELPNPPGQNFTYNLQVKDQIGDFTIPISLSYSNLQSPSDPCPIPTTCWRFHHPRWENLQVENFECGAFDIDIIHNRHRITLNKIVYIKPPGKKIGKIHCEFGFWILAYLRAFGIASLWL
ncbi:hypothetical protein LXL04_018075 [Taraxacum kok-saghyz]